MMTPGRDSNIINIRSISIITMTTRRPSGRTRGDQEGSGLRTRGDQEGSCLRTRGDQEGPGLRTRRDQV